MNIRSAEAKDKSVPIKTRVIAGLAPLSLVAAFFWWQHYYPASASTGWSVDVLHDNVQKAASLAKGPSNEIVVSEELQNEAGNIIAIDSSGHRTLLVSKLSKPDGLAAFDGGYAFSQEGGAAPVSLLKNGVVTPLFDAINAQGLLADGDDLYAVEDRKLNGRLFKYNRVTGQTEILRDSLDEAESFTICPNGDRFYTEKGRNLVRRFTEDKKDPLFLGPEQVREPSYLLCDENGLWVVEDRTHLARVLLVSPQGAVSVIANHLRAPQVLMKLGSGNDAKYALAEGGRSRILELKKTQ
ncbi:MULTISPECIES: hypothetical protein [Pseudomonas]|uniref:Strictosidine synthase conserved region domain-containing protein n=1 Tax=Pseudomonas aphyarum TaxID=2942629 RepID=A0ABT5PPU1_9PSED|nr:hypothetical protein [Pseudomonas aphyarum]MDD0971118.1 hypothetical protein [Pseudomonas aphyarum]MDD1125916.1 hypothetical protein [Pseudomonas aphyarum]